MGPDVSLLVFDTHPVQYRVPLWREISKIVNGKILVVYASDCSLVGFKDEGFGKTFAWDDPLLEGYSSVFLHSEDGTPMSGWASLTGKGVIESINKYKPKALMITGLNYKYEFIVYLEALKRGLPLWIRCENQDEAFTRNQWKSFLRSLFYKCLYFKIDRFFSIGELNKSHYLNHGVPKSKIFDAKYTTIDRCKNYSTSEKIERRISTRKIANIDKDGLVVGFSGKFILKKDPNILFKMLGHLDPSVLSKLTLYFMGSGILENELKNAAKSAEDKYNIKTHFTGFINQSELAGHYLAMDILVLPSKRMGETWGLVANEAMQAGCSVVLSNAVGSGADFKTWDRVEIFSEGNEIELAQKLNVLSKFEKDFNWAIKYLEEYSVEYVGMNISKYIQLLE